jgi:2-phosphosulfolactate phosphatase
MIIDVAFLPADIDGRDLSNTVCIVLDIFRASTSIVTALDNGCEAIFPVLSVEEGHGLAQQRGSCLLAGERHSLKLDGFDFGNSPFDFLPDKVKGRQIIMTTTNGTVAIRSTEGAYRTLIGSFLNATAVCKQTPKYHKEVLIVCAGTERLFSLEDALCAGLLVEILRGGKGAAVLTDAAYAASLMYSQAKAALAAVAINSRNGKRLCELGREDDVAYCLRLGTVDIVPEYRNGAITLL